MKRFFSSARTFMLAGAGVLASGMLLTSCLKDNDSNNNDVAAGLMAFNLSTDQSAAGFKIGGNTLTQFPLAYSNFTGVYLPVYPGTRTIDAFSFNSGNTLATSSADFKTDKFYSVFLVGSGSSLENVIVEDKFDSLSSSGKAYVRYINAIADASSSTVTIASGGTNVVSESASFKSVSDFEAVDAGAVAITVSNGGTINVNRTITLESRKVYTVLLIGKPGETGDNAVQIKFVANGQLTDNAARIGSASSGRSV
ncbi:MAG TPA: DUF4397 domain-containing protein, partial [Chitinophagaceae bacterium]